MISLVRNLSLAWLCAVLAGCLSIPSPNDLAGSCERSHDSVDYHATGDRQRYQETIRARCVDDDTHRTVVAVDRRGSQGTQSIAINYQNRLGEKTTQAQVTARKTGRALAYESVAEGTTGVFVWRSFLRINVNP